ncbi:MerR family transcriptional regulator [Bacillus cereus group sp. N6]|uniref:MerR family transcriptional regulator n=1 Tax=Bacillus cereus group sp. N6 TaxID=2794583 RepID=UPI0018F713F7|nr:MerR family transcriptional regulator [Bacillus cereus group sp. N6]MBJ8113146.1 MerR family transcriptional regulator [Bacillus cereus group sp. N6]
MNDYGYFSKQVCEDLNLTASTLRRWSIAFESKGYEFEKNEKGQRIYFERDYRILREYKRLLDQGISAEQCLEDIAKRFIKIDAAQTPSVHGERNASMEKSTSIDRSWLHELQVTLEQQAATIGEQNQHIIKQQDEMLNRMISLEMENANLKENITAQTELIKEIKEEQKKKEKKKLFGLF